MATGNHTLHQNEVVYAESLVVNGNALTGTELGYVDGLTAGTVTASKAVVVSADKDIGDFRNLDAVNIDAGASAVAGTVDIFPSTAASGKVSLTAADSAGDTTTTIVNASQAGARTYTIPDAGGNASFVMSAGAATIAGAKTFSTMPIIPVATVAAAGTVQGDAAAITTGFTLVTGADDAAGVRLPAAAGGLVCIIKVGDGADLKVWPATGDAINGLGANNALTVVDDVCFALVAFDATTWYTLPLLPS